MFNSVEMVKMNMLVMEKYMLPLTEALGELGLVHLIDAADQSADHLLHDVDRNKDIDHLQSLKQRCETLLDSLNIACSKAEITEDMPPVYIEKILNEVEAKLDVEEKSVQELSAQIKFLHKQINRLAEFPFQQVPLSTLRDLSHLYIRTGRLSPNLLPKLSEIRDRSLVLHKPTQEGHEEVIVLTSRKNRWAVDSELAKVGFKYDEIPADIPDSAAEENAKMQNRLHKLVVQIQQHRDRAAKLGAEYTEPLCRIHTKVVMDLAVAEAQQHFGQAGSLRCISGWLPKNKTELLQQMAEKVTKGTSVIEFVIPKKDALVRAGREKVPILFRQIPALRPFQRLVTTFGAPTYGDIEPSLFVAFSFILMFGIMFGDVGQGAVVTLLGAYLLHTRHAGLAKFRDSGWLLIFCGFSAIIFGFLYGSVFGSEDLLPALWLSPLEDMMQLLKTAVIVGIIFISVSIIINIVNKFSSGRYFEAIIDRFGIIGIFFYWGSIGLGLKALYAQKLTATEIILVIVLPLTILFLREPLHALLQRRRTLLQQDVLTFSLESSMEILETVTAFLGSTVSFVRIGAFALSHAALSLAIYSVVDLLRDVPGSGFLSVITIIVGNVLVIGLEGMVAMIQGLRLEYYELFTKYFTGDGVLFTPFELPQESKGNKSP